VAKVVSIDGVLSPPEEAKVSVYDRGFLYGDSVFETIRTYSGKPFALEEHLARLETSARKVFIDLPVSLDTFAAEVNTALRAANNLESYVRIMLTRGQAALGLNPALATTPLRVILVGPLEAPNPQLLEQGIHVVTFKTLRPADATIAEGAKIGNYLVAVLAMREAQLHDAQEALIMDAHGRVVEGASSNLFFVRGNVLFTPPLSTGILAGITRERVLKAAASLGIRAEFETPTLEELCSADEAFISSSIRELLPITRLNSASFSTGTPGPIFRRLLEEFRRGIASENA
jgi:branched-chain amino acid aminotransferase